MKRKLPVAFIELQRTCRIDSEELKELLQCIDVFEQLREEDFHTQGNSYQGTGEGARQLSKLLSTAMLKATYIPKNTQELLVLPSQLGMSIFRPNAYDPADQVCHCIRDQWECYFPQEYPASARAKKESSGILWKMAELLYRQQRSHLSIDEMKESYLSPLVMRSKRTLATHIAMLIEIGFIQGAAPGRRFSLQVDYEFAPLFTVLRTLQRQTRAEMVSIL